MKIDHHTTSLHSSNDSIMLYGEFSLLLGGETPLPVPGHAAGQATNRLVIVHPDVIRTYQQIIFELEGQVLRYKALLRHWMREPEPTQEVVAELSSPLNAASINVVNSILRARISEKSILRAFDEGES